MYDEEVLIENIHVWFVTMSSSNSRPFRHTATLINLTMTSAMCQIAQGELVKAAKIRQQIKSEQKKGGNKARIVQFQANIETSEKKYDFLLEKIKAKNNVKVVRVIIPKTAKKKTKTLLYVTISIINDTNTFCTRGVVIKGTWYPYKPFTNGAALR